MRILLVLAGLILWASSAVAEQSAAFCAAAKKSLEDDSAMAAAAIAVFGTATSKRPAKTALTR
jgi:hypothetical protein